MNNDRNVLLTDEERAELVVIMQRQIDAWDKLRKRTERSKKMRPSERAMTLAEAQRKVQTLSTLRRKFAA